jgi:xylan 1,4-beta-xylosidase
LASSMSYWDLSDVFEEQGVVKTPFYGGYGLIAERNIPKAAFRVFELLHKLGDQRIEAASENTLITRRADGTYVVALWNYAEPKSEVAPKTFQLALKGVKAKTYRMQFVAPGSGSALEAWSKMGSPVSPTRAQVEELKKSSQMLPARNSPISNPVILAPQTLAILELQ